MVPDFCPGTAGFPGKATAFPAGKEAEEKNIPVRDLLERLFHDAGFGFGQIRRNNGRTESPVTAGAGEISFRVPGRRLPATRRDNPEE